MTQEPKPSIEYAGLLWGEAGCADCHSPMADGDHLFGRKPNPSRGLTLNLCASCAGYENGPTREQLLHCLRQVDAVARRKDAEVMTYLREKTAQIRAVERDKAERDAANR